MKILNLFLYLRFQFRLISMLSLYQFVQSKLIAYFEIRINFTLLSTQKKVLSILETRGQLSNKTFKKTNEFEFISMFN